MIGPHRSRTTDKFMEPLNNVYFGKRRSTRDVPQTNSIPRGKTDRNFDSSTITHARNLSFLFVIHKTFLYRE